MTSPKSRRALVAQHRRKNPRVLGGIDVDKAVARMRQLPVFKDHRLPRKIQIDVGFSELQHIRGTAWTHQDRMRVQGFPESPPHHVVDTILHELVHLACPVSEHHGERFRRVYARAVRELWEIDVPVTPPIGHHSCFAYAQGALVVAALKGRDFSAFAPDPPKPKKPRHEAINEKVRGRAEHTKKMLKKATTRRKRAETLEKKWKQKVAYYAKKGL